MRSSVSAMRRATNFSPIFAPLAASSRTRRPLQKVILDLIQDALFARLVGGWQQVAQFLKQAPLLARKLGRDVHIQMHIEVAAASALNARHAQAANAQPRAGLRPFRNLQRLNAVEGVQLDRSAESGLRDVDGKGAMQVVFLALENRVFGDFDDHVEIAGRTAVDSRLAFLRQAKLRPVVHARRNIHLEPSLAANVAFASAIPARPADNLSASAALRASPPDGKKGLLIEDLAAALAGGADDQSVFGLGAFAVAMMTLLHARNLDIGRQAAHGIFKSDLQIVAEILAALRAVAALRAPAPEEVAETEYVAENVAQVGKTGVEAAGPGGRGDALMAEAVIGGALLRI